MVWSLALASAAIAWNVFLLTWDSTATPSWLLPSIIASAAAFGFRRRAPWFALLFECGAGAAAVGGSCLLTWFYINASATNPDHPFALGIGGVFIAAATFVVMCPGFFSAYALRTMLVRVATRP